MQQSTKSNTKAALIRAAERLFAEKGLGTVSVKDITVAAGAKNPSAVHYHFGNIEALMREVFAHRYKSIESARLQRLTALLQSGSGWTLQQFLEAAIGPLFESCMDEDGRLYARFCVQLAADPRFDVMALVQDIGMKSVVSLREGLSSKIDHVPAEVLQARLRLAFKLSLMQSADFARDLEAGTAPPVAKAVSEAAAGLAGFLQA